MTPHTPSSHPQTKQKIAAFSALAIIASLSLTNCSKTGEVPARPASSHVLDQADIFTDAQEQSINRTIDIHSTAENWPEVMIITYPDDRGKTLDYATEVGNQWGVGKDINDYGVVIAMSTGTQNAAVAVAEGAEEQITDDEAKDIVTGVLKPALEDKTYSYGIDRALTRVYEETSASSPTQS